MGDWEFFYTFLAPHLPPGSLFCVVFALESLQRDQARVVTALQNVIVQRFRRSLVTFSDETILTTPRVGVYDTEISRSNIRALYECINDAGAYIRDQFMTTGVRFTGSVWENFRFVLRVNHMRTRDDGGYALGGVRPTHGPSHLVLYLNSPGFWAPMELGLVTHLMRFVVVTFIINPDGTLRMLTNVPQPQFDLSYVGQDFLLEYGGGVQATPGAPQTGAGRP
jgi:hypothetical protein